MQYVRAFLHDESAITSVEYGLLAALISVASLAALKSVGNKLSSAFSKAGGSLS